jgi:hypothetical protein
MTKFFVASCEFDPINVGFSTRIKMRAFEFAASIPEITTGYDTNGKNCVADDK